MSCLLPASTRHHLAIGCLLLAATSAAAADSWHLNTFPGPGHLAHPAPWGPGQGCGRTEKINAFGVSPLDGDFMLMLTDLAPVSYSTDGSSFLPGRIPLRGGSAVAFSHHDPAVGYVLIGSAEAQNRSGRSGWWRTADSGRSWRLWWSDRDAEGATTEHYGRLHGNRILRSDPIDPARVYVASFARGLLVLDDEASDPHGHGSVLAFAGRRIKTLAAGVRAGATVLYAIVGTGGDSADKDHGGELWRLLIDDAGGVVDQRRLAEGADWTEIACDPANDGRGFAIRNFAEVRRFDDWGDDWSASVDRSPIWDLQFPGAQRFYSLGINPADSDHVVISAHNGYAWQDHFNGVLLYSTDGGDSWAGMQRDESTVDGTTYIPDFHFYGPNNFRSAAGDFAFHHHKPGGSGALASYGQLAFIPGDPRGFRVWGGNWEQRAPLQSRDGGASLRPFAHGGSFKQPVQIDAHLDADGQLHLASAHVEHGFKVSHDGGRSWHGFTHQNTPDPFGRLHSEADAEVPSAKGAFFASSGWGIAFDPDPADRGRTIVACYGFFFRDLDGDNENHEAIDTRIVRSADGGATWQDTGATARIRIWINPTGHLVHWGRRSNGTSVVYVGNQRSRDGGLTWSTMSQDVVAVSAGDGDLVVGSVYSDPSSRADHVFQVSLDGGDSWQPLPETPQVDLGVGGKVTMPARAAWHPLAIDPRPERNPRLGPDNHLRLLLAGGAGVHVYDAAIDDARWQDPIHAGIHLRNGFRNADEQHYELDQIRFDPRPGFHHIVYAGESGIPGGNHYNNPEFLAPIERPERRLFRSADGGSTWTALIAEDDPAIDPYIEVRGLEVDQAGRLYVNDWSGVWVRSASAPWAPPGTPPVITSGPVADPSPVRGTMTSLTASATDDGGADELLWRWTATGPAPVIFEPNDARDADSCTAIFDAAGTYEIRVRVQDADGGSASEVVTVVVEQTVGGITIPR